MGKKIVWSIVISVLGIGFVIGCLVVGYKLGLQKGNQERITEELKEVEEPVDDSLDVMTIAIVNLDEGIEKDGKIINYANELIDYTSEYLVSTSLEAARIGVEEGKYAAYVIIPATFSENVSSINGTPIESQIQYALCNKLSSQSGLLAMSNVHMLINSLNDNVSYMYVDSILNEFHTAQNGVDEILANGRNANQIINSITPEDISANVEIPSDNKIDYSTENVDFTQYLTDNKALISEINTEYSDGFSKSKTEKGNLISDATALGERIAETNTKLKSVDIETDAEGNYVYDTELKSLTDSLNGYNQQLTASLQPYKDVVISMNNSLDAFKTDLTNVIQCYSDTVDYYNSNLTSNLNALTTTLTTGTYKLNKAKENFKQSQADNAIVAGSVDVTYSSEDIKTYVLTDTNGNVNIEALYDMLSEFVQMNGVTYSVTVSDSETNISEVSTLIGDVAQFDKSSVYKKNENDEYEKQEKDIDVQVTDVHDRINTLKEELKIFEEEQSFGIDTQTIVGDVKANVVNKLAENAKSVTKSIRDEYKKESDALATFNSGIASYDPFSYINQEKIKEKTSKLSTSTDNLESAILQKNTNDTNNMNKIYEQYSKNLGALKESITSAVDSSNKSVEEGLENAKNALNTNSNRNEELLASFAQKLLYTRNGSLGNYQIYKFIVNPFEVINMTEQVVEAKPEKNVEKQEQKTVVKENQVIYVIVIVSGLAIILAITMIIRYQRREKNNYNL